jgi:hypothetical protein
MTSHHGHRYDPYSDAAAPYNNTTTTKIGMGSQGCTMDQRVAFLCSLYKLSKTSKDVRIFADPQFLQLNFKDLIHEPIVIRVALLYGCHKLFPEARVLARNCGVAELEEQVGKFMSAPFGIITGHLQLRILMPMVMHIFYSLGSSGQNFAVRTGGPALAVKTK